MRKKRRVPVPSRAREPRVRLDVDSRRAQLVELGIEFFGSRAYDEVSIDDVARAATISKGLLYHYFPTKRDFYVAVVRAAAERLVARTIGSSTRPPLDRLRDGLDAYLTYVDQHGSAYAALMRSGIGTDPEVARIVDSTRQRLVDELVHGLANAEPSAITPLVRASLRGWVGFVEAASLDWVEHRDLDRAVLRDLLSKVLIDAWTRANEGE
jgi:AcrR family transcriptional regulator